MNIGIKAALDSRPEMGFWPAAVQALRYSQSATFENLLLFIILAFAGGVMYHLLNRGRSFIKAIGDQSKNQINRGRRRGEGPGDDDFEKTLESLKEFSNYIRPDQRLSFSIVVIGFVANLGGSIYLYYELVDKVIINSNPTIAETTLLILPALYVVVSVTGLLWVESG